MNRYNYQKFLEIQARVRSMPEFNKTPLEDLHKLDKEQLIKEYAGFRDYTFNKMNLVSELIDLLLQELGK